MVSYNPQIDSYSLNMEESPNFFISIGLITTTRCNQACFHCNQPNEMPDMLLNDLKQIIDIISSQDTIRINMGGGEPGLRKDLVGIVRYISEKDIYVTVSTNGSLFDKERLKAIQPYVANIRYSIYGTRKTHDYVTGCDGSFDKVIQSINAAKEIGIPVSVVSTVMSCNYSEMIDVARCCEKNNVEKLFFFSLVKKGRANMIYQQQNVPLKEMTEQFDKILYITQKERWNLCLELVDSNLEGRCILLYPNGNLIVSPSFTDNGNSKNIGNLFVDSPRQIWEKYPFKNNYIEGFRKPRISIPNKINERTNDYKIIIKKSQEV